MGRQRMKADYEEVRKTQILENKARLASLGVQKTIGELRTKSQSEKKKNNKVDYSAPLRRCNRFKVGVPCHFCRQKKFCGEKGCKRCGYSDMDQPCLGKTDCSICHSSNGVLCRGCLKVQYGEEMEDVIANKEWICPHCTEEKGINPYWICNSSLCLKKRKMAPTGIDIFKAREMGYKSVAHLLMDQLQGVVKGR